MIIFRFLVLLCFGSLALAARAENPFLASLSDEERAFLRDNPVVRVGVERVGWPPFEVFTRDGQFQGIAADYLTQLETLLGIRFEIVTTLSWDDVLNKARTREIDVLPSAVSTPERLQYLLFTEPYVRSPMVMVTRDQVEFIADTALLQGMRVGVVTGYISDELLSRDYPQLALIRHPGTVPGLHSVARGEDDVFIDNLAVVSYLIKSEGLANLKISGQTPYFFNLAMGIRNDWPLLHSAMQKAMQSMSAQEHDAIYNRWVKIQLTEQIAWGNYWPLLLAAAVLFVLLTLYLVHLHLLNRKIHLAHRQLAAAELALREKNRELEILSVTDKLTGCYNRHHLDSILTKAFEHSHRYNRPLALVLFDLDHFKQINDRFGHQAGDRVLQAFVALVQNNIRRSDVFGRWGGEEFMLICPETSEEQAMQVAEKIRQSLAELSILEGFQTTTSAGVACDLRKSSVDDLILTADQQLYEAKRLGRNRVC